VKYWKVRCITRFGKHQQKCVRSLIFVDLTKMNINRKTMVALHEKLADGLPKLKAALREAGYCESDIKELIRLFAGLEVLICFAVDSESFDRDKVNRALCAEIGSGFSWYAALKYLTGQRARDVHVKRTDLVREIGGSRLVQAFNTLLPQLKGQF
jgi:hypothetical protein